MHVAVRVGVAHRDLVFWVQSKGQACVSEMAGEKKSPSFITKAYLLAYNGVLTAG